MKQYYENRSTGFSPEARGKGLEGNDLHELLKSLEIDEIKRGEHILIIIIVL